jgi:hypothetical protein
METRKITVLQTLANPAEVAKFLGVNESKFHRLVREEILPPAIERGKYDLQRCAQVYTTHQLLEQIERHKR